MFSAAATAGFIFLYRRYRKRQDEIDFNRSIIIQKVFKVIDGVDVIGDNAYKLSWNNYDIEIIAATYGAVITFYYTQQMENIKVIKPRELLQLHISFDGDAAFEKLLSDVITLAEAINGGK